MRHFSLAILAFVVLGFPPSSAGWMSVPEVEECSIFEVGRTGVLRAELNETTRKRRVCRIPCQADPAIPAFARHPAIIKFEPKEERYFFKCVQEGPMKIER
ncbi:hypothetical protein K8Q93_00390 [Candidatus Parcubacteria bacterium]|nr:hypothetical protein [Candidatus Parcubacteria bacterium]